MDSTNLHHAATAFMLAMAAMGSASAAEQDPLHFPAGAYTLQTRLVNSGKVGHVVRYRAWRNILYVRHAASAARQHLDLDMPVEIDGRAIDASQAPIVVNIVLRPSATARPSTIANEALKATTGAQRRADLALAAGYVVVTPAIERGDPDAATRTTEAVPIQIGDLKAAVRYLRHNAGEIPGNPDWVISAGCGTAGRLSAQLGASGDEARFLPYLRLIGAAEASDKVFASACYSPFNNLPPAGMAHEPAPATMLARRKDGKKGQPHGAAFMSSRHRPELNGPDGSDPHGGGSLADDLLKHYLEPSATRYLIQMDATRRDRYLQANPWIHWERLTARFSLADFAGHIRHSGELQIAGTSVLPSRDGTDQTDPMESLSLDNPPPTHNWLLRAGTAGSAMFPALLVALATRLEHQGKDVSTSLSWDEEQCTDDDPAGLVAWIAGLTGYPASPLDKK